MNKYVLFSRIFWSVFFTLYAILLVFMIYLAGKYIIIPTLEFIGTNIYAKATLVLIIAVVFFRLISNDDDKYRV